ncbi:MAG: hypothetical protein ABFD52_04920 [Acidobacteriota bacterium]
MKKTNGGKVQLKKGAAMWMGGAIRLVLKPDLCADLAAGKQITIDFGTPGTCEWNELDLQVEAGPENKIKELSPWFDLDQSLLEVKNSVITDGPEYVQDYFAVYLEESENRSMGFTINGKQARALADMLLAYCRVCESIEALETTPTTA